MKKLSLFLVFIVIGVSVVFTVHATTVKLKDSRSQQMFRPQNLAAGSTGAVINPCPAGQVRVNGLCETKRTCFNGCETYNESSNTCSAIPGMVIVGGSCQVLASCRTCETRTASNTCSLNSGWVVIGGACQAKASCNNVCETWQSSTNTCAVTGSIANGTYAAGTCLIACATDYKLNGAGNGCESELICSAETCVAENGGIESDWTATPSGSTCNCTTPNKYVMMMDMPYKDKCPGATYYTNLRRIKAVKDFGTIRKGDLGGYIEKYSNLSQTGNAWVGCDVRGCAIVTQNSVISENALVEGAGETNMSGIYETYSCGATRVQDGIIYGNAKVLAGSSVISAKVYGSAIMHGIGRYPSANGYCPYFTAGTYYVSAINGYNSAIGAELYENAQIYMGGYVSSGKIHGYAIIAGGLDRFGGLNSCRAYAGGEIYGNAIVMGADVSGNAKVFGSAKVTHSSQISGNAQIYDNAVIERGYVQGNAKVYGSAKYSPQHTGGGETINYLCGNAVMSGSAKVTTKVTSTKNTICKNSYASGEIAWQESYCSSANCPK